MNNCLVCHKIVEKDRRYSPYFYDFCSKCYEHFTRRVQRHAQRARKIGTYTKLSPSEVIQLIREQISVANIARKRLSFLAKAMRTICQLIMNIH